MKRFLIPWLLLLPAWLSAQNIAPVLIGACGQAFTGATAILEWSAGEAGVASLVAPASLLTEGFHQPRLMAAAITEDQAVLMEVWPNPVAETLHLRSTEVSPGPLHLELYNALGQCVLQHDWKEAASELQLSLAHLAAGAYTLVVGGNRMTRTYAYHILKLAD